MSTIPTTTNPDWDILNSKVLASYFTAREHEVYLSSLRWMEDRRDFYPQFVRAAMQLLTFFDDAASLELLDSVIFRSRKKLENVSQGLSILDYLRKANSRGVELLELSPPVTFDSLRSAYKKAALAYHPDRGGSNEDMKLVNLAFEEFHEVISQWKETPATERPTDSIPNSTVTLGWGGPGIPIRSAADYLNWLGTMLVRVHTDSWAVDRAYTMVRSFREHGSLSSSLSNQVNFAAPFAFALIRLATMLRTASLLDEAEYVLDCASPLAEVCRTSSHLHLTLERARAKNAPDRFRKLKPAIMHPCQAENLFRLKIIDEGMYRKAQARLPEPRSQDLALTKFREQGGFILVSHDLPLKCEPGVKPFVPIPGLPNPVTGEFHDRIELLSDDQRAEYFRVFGPSASPPELKRYFYIRITSYLCSLIHSFSDDEAEKIEHECKFLQELFPDIAARFDPVLGVSGHLRQLDPATRMEKLRLLQGLDRMKPPPMNIISLTRKRPLDPYIRAEPTPEYLSVVMAPVDRLRMALQTGSIETVEEENKRRADWSHDINLIRGLRSDRNAVTAKAWDAVCHHLREPQRVVGAVKPHIEQLLAARGKIAPQNVDQLGVGWWVDVFSTALVKLKRWDEARQWLELFFSLVARRQEGRPEQGNREKMLRRLTRCKAHLAK